MTTKQVYEFPPLASPVPADTQFLVQQSGVTYSLRLDEFYGALCAAAYGHIAASSGVHGISGDVVGTDDSQVLSNKTWLGDLQLNGDIFQTTSGGSDNRSISVGGGGAILTARGAYLTWYGANHATYSGQIRGEAAGGFVFQDNFTLLGDAVFEGECTVLSAPVLSDTLYYNIQCIGTNPYNANAASGITFANEYTSGSDVAGMGGMSVTKENAVDGEYGAYLSLFSRAHGSGVAEALRLESDKTVAINGATGIRFDVVLGTEATTSGLLLVEGGKLVVKSKATGSWVTVEILATL